MAIQSFAVYNRDSGIRKKSSSGGVFFEIARLCIEKRGVVFGAAFNKEWKVIHEHANELKEVDSFLGSKYVQSSIGGEYAEVKQKLNQGKICLFSGTPCQIAGLKSYLGKEYENLITVDFICHGVPSPGVWRKYVESQKGEKAKKISFRDKTEGWLRFSLRIDYEDGEIYRKSLNEDLYMQGFLKNIYLRPSCYECYFKGMDRKSDITLADYWGIQKDIPNMFDDLGTSAVFLHSEIGNKIWNEIQDHFIFCEVNMNDPIVHNISAISSVNKTKKRKIFFRKDTFDFKVLRRLVKEPVIKKIYYISIRITHKLKEMSEVIFK